MWGNNGNNSTMRNLPYVREYSLAKRIFDSTKPMRGNGVNAGIKPLGARNNVTAYSVRAGTVDATDVEFVLYKTPVITFKEDGRILVFMERWNTNTTREFINTILNVNCYAKSGKSVLETYGQASIIPPTGLVLRYDVEAMPPRLVFEGKPKFTGYAVSRAKANKVRAQFSQFAKYFKGCVSLRSVEMVEKSYYAGDYTKYNAIEYTGAEIIEVLGDEPTATVANPWTGWDLLKHRPFHQFRPMQFGTYANWIAAYNAKCEEFFDLIKDDQPDETKTQNFYKAMVICMILNSKKPNRETPNKVIHTLTNNVTNNFDDIWKMYFAKDILEEVVLGDGVTPNQTYANWMWMYNQEKVDEAEAQERKYMGVV